MTKTTFLAVAVLLLCAAVQLQKATAEACPRWRTVTGPTGITLKLCQDGKYSTCMRDSRRLGWQEAEGRSYCDRLLAQGRVK